MTHGEMQIALTRTRDILGWLGEHRVPGQVLCGFSMETRDMVFGLKENKRIAGFFQKIMGQGTEP